MNKSKRIFVFNLLFFMLSLTLSNTMWAIPSPESKEKELEETAEVQTHTLAPPLLGSAFVPTASFREGLSLLGPSHEPGYWGSLEYEAIGNKSFRLLGRDFKEPSGFFWLLEEAADLRNRWVEVVYSGPAVPSQVLVSFDSRMQRRDSDYIVPMKSSFQPKSSFIKLPDRAPFSKIKRFSFHFDPKFGQNVEMILLDLKVLPKGADPLAQASTPDAG